MKITLRTLTPLWTGGVDQTSDRLHETGLIGSLRWWYEALVRGLGGYACDPTSDDPEARCEFDAKAYEQAKKDGKGETEAIQAGLHTVCPVCYLFGATGWARLFVLRTIEVPIVHLHFLTTVGMNQNWLEKIFGGENQQIDPRASVPYGKLTFDFIPRRGYEDYATSQIALLFRLIADYGGLGARLQHGFGQIQIPLEFVNVSIDIGIQKLQSILQAGFLYSNSAKISDTPFDWQNLVTLDYEISADNFQRIRTSRYIVGTRQKQNETRYLPCAFDLRYKGSQSWGLREWLKRKGWQETTDPENLEELDLLLGPRSQWEMDNKKKQIADKLRTASRVFFGMPYQKEGSKDIYILRVWAFWPPELQHRLLDVQALKALLDEYIQHAFSNKAKKVSETLGKDILTQTTGGTK